MAHLNPCSYNSYHQSSPFFTSLEEAIQYVAHSTGPPPPSSEHVGPPGPGRIPCAPGSQSSPRKLANSAKVVVATPSLAPSSSTPAPSTLPSDRVRIVHGRMIRIPPPAQCLAPLAPPPSSSVPLHATEAQIAAESKVHFFKEQEHACLAAAETKCCLEAEQQRKEKRLVKEHWEEDMREQERLEKNARRQYRGLVVPKQPPCQAGSSTSCSLGLRTAMSCLVLHDEDNEDRVVVTAQSSIPTPPVDLHGNVPKTLSPAPHKTPLHPL
ncbi:hypothetical protein BT96DRAFT_993133 [Gymnopus androsaceus JB14]|uniref:Uncharacterized protein n=1 Tax=Gymnopus androsaceus JB14 TaxID=1447944 RepID=A0A6A4HMV0_9AGAR|nr:hypothetical protein BT96DRAFT_993133 [Gymnopus androsaceus JB14]